MERNTVERLSIAFTAKGKRQNKLFELIFLLVGFTEILIGLPKKGHQQSKKKNCVNIVFDFSWDIFMSQEKSKTITRRGVLWELRKLRMVGKSLFCQETQLEFDNRLPSLGASCSFICYEC